MGLTYVDLVLANPADSSCRAEVQRCMVDTGSELTWVPAKVLRAIGVEPEKERRFILAYRRVAKRRVGFAILEFGPYRTIDEVVFGEAADLILVGARSLEGFGLAVDPQSHKLRTTPTIAAQNRPRPRRARRSK
jgi:predicted aspartyl protease